MAMTIGVMARLVSSSIKDGKESGEYTKARSTLLAGIGSNFCASVFSATNAGMGFDDALPVGHRKALDVLLAALQNITFVEGVATLARRGAAGAGNVEQVLLSWPDHFTRRHPPPQRERPISQMALPLANHR